MKNIAMLNIFTFDMFSVCYSLGQSVRGRAFLFYNRGAWFCWVLSRWRWHGRSPHRRSKQSQQTAKRFRTIDRIKTHSELGGGGDRKQYVEYRSDPIFQHHPDPQPWFKVFMFFFIRSNNVTKLFINTNDHKSYICCLVRYCAPVQNKYN